VIANSVAIEFAAMLARQLIRYCHLNRSGSDLISAGRPQAPQ
jgi:hypothetical protein